MMLRSILKIVIMLLSILSFPALPGDMSGQQVTDGERAFLAELAVALKHDNRQWVADHVSFPLAVRRGREKLTVKDRRGLLAQYPKIFSQNLIDVVAKQSPEKLFKNWSGVMIGRGQIWFVEVTPKDAEASARVSFFITSVSL